MNDEEFDDLLRDAAASYNTPVDAPRDAMWEAIARARSASAVTPIASAGRTRRWLTAAAGIAAVLLVGIAIGRASRGTVADAPTVATNSTPGADSPRLSPDSTNQTVAAKEANDGAAIDITPRGSAREGAAQRQLGVAALRRARRDAGSTAGDLAGDASAYRLAVVEHLTRTEVLLTSFRAEAQTMNSAKLDAQFASLSRELLGTTRLLLATRRGEDPAITRLLQDLEFVLMQLSQYANDGRRIDLDALNQSLDKRNVIPKLRSTIPAGVSASAGT
jgi:hypothetical protein